MWIALSLLLVTTDSIFSTNPLPSVFGHLSMIVALLLVLTINYYGYYLWAAIGIISAGEINFTLFSIVYSPAIYAEFYLLMFPCLAISLFQKRTIPVLTLITSFCLFSFVIIKYNYYETRYPGPAMGILFLSIFIIIDYLKRLNQQNEKLLEQEKHTIQRQANELKELYRFRTHFFVNLSHEIRTPLTLIKGYSHRLQVFDGEQKKLNVIKTQVRQISDMIDNIMDLSRLDTQDFPLSKTKFDLVKLFKELHEEFCFVFDKKEIQLTLSIVNTAIYIVADKKLMQRAISNLLTNALKFTEPKGTVNMLLEISSEMTIKISDTGLGIPKKDLHAIFNRYYQSSNKISKASGSGIGLSIVKGIIEKHDYQISVKSSLHIGSVFCITIAQNDFTFN